jgi:hypothetical protein
MSEIFDKLTPPQLTAVICTVAGVVALVVFIVSIWSYQVRALADQTALERERQNADIAMQKEQVQADIALKQELVKRNLPAAELKLALEAIESASPVASDEEAEEEDEGVEEEDGEDPAGRVLKTLTAWGDEVDSKIVEETVALVAAADRSTLRVLADVLDESAKSASSQTAFAIARAFCKAAANKPAGSSAKAEVVAEPVAGKPPIDLQFQRSFGAS